MNVLFKQSATKQILATLSHLMSSESFASFSVHPFKLMSYLYRTENNGSPDTGIRKFYCGTKSLEAREWDAIRARFETEDSVFEEEKIISSKNEELVIAKLGITMEIVSCLAKRGITTMFPIQRAVLEPAMQGHDMIGCAKTGTGKTLAFGIPIMDKILQFNAKHGRGRNPLALILAPTREHARQVEKEFRESSSLDTICVYGGVPIQSQIKTLHCGVDIVVGTPSRIIDLIKRSSLMLSEIQFVVLDEADQMLTVGFDEDVEVILDKLPKKHQTMMFSATMPSWLGKLTHKYLEDPATIDLVGENYQKLAEGITLYSIATENYLKASTLELLLKEHAKEGKCIVFTQTKHNADRLAYAMSKSVKCEPLHGDISQNQKEKTLSGFRDGRFNILIATDIAARGLDVPNVNLVIHYEMPTTSEIFVHRSSRTGLPGKKGSAVLIHTYEQSRAVRALEIDVGCKFTQLPKMTTDGRDEDMFTGNSGGRMSAGRLVGRSPASFGDFGSLRRGSSLSSSGLNNSGFGNSDSIKSGSFGSFGTKSSSGFGRFSNFNKFASEECVQKL